MTQNDRFRGKELFFFQLTHLMIEWIYFKSYASAADASYEDTNKTYV